MLKFEVHREVTDRDRGVTDAFTVSVWLDAAEVFSVTPHNDAAWSILTFKASAGRRGMIVRGAAEAVAAQIGAEVDRSRWPTRRMQA